MMHLRSFAEYGLGNTPIHRAGRYCPAGNLYLKLETENPDGSVKDRTGYYIVWDLAQAGKLKPGTKLVESSSGNLGLAIAHFAREAGVRFLCLVDPLIAPEKLRELQSLGVDVHVVSLGNCPDYRSARIQMARDLALQPDWVWTNQYDNPANVRAHYETTGPEIWSQMERHIDYMVCSVGTGGTICGIGHYLKEQDTRIKIVAVEPSGSTIFGGEPGEYICAGAGMRNPSGIIRKHGQVVDFYCKVHDRVAARECVSILSAENLSVGLTAGSVIFVASWLALQHPDETIVGLVPDGGAKYSDLIERLLVKGEEVYDVTLVEHRVEKPQQSSVIDDLPVSPRTGSTTCAESQKLVHDQTLAPGKHDDQ